MLVFNGHSGGLTYLQKHENRQLEIVKLERDGRLFEEHNEVPNSTNVKGIEG